MRGEGVVGWADMRQWGKRWNVFFSKSCDGKRRGTASITKTVLNFRNLVASELFSKVF